MRYLSTFLRKRLLESAKAIGSFSRGQPWETWRPVVPADAGGVATSPYRRWELQLVLAKADGLTLSQFLLMVWIIIT